jgi:hypothetical protein
MNRPERNARVEEGTMALYAVDVRNGLAQRVTEEYDRRDNQHCILIAAGSAKQAWAKVSRSLATGSAECDCCRHRFCNICEECSVAKQYSDYWICHCCGELNLRVPNMSLREVSHGLGKD